MLAISLPSSLQVYLARYQPNSLPLVKPCSLLAQHAHYQPTTELSAYLSPSRQTCLLSAQHAHYQPTLLVSAYLAPFHQTLLTISTACSPTLLPLDIPCLLSAYYARYLATSWYTLLQVLAISISYSVVPSLLPLGIPCLLSA
jgi:hypothetical protein